MNDVLKARLVESLLSNRLVIFTGAGLSMTPPSAVPSAADLTQRCVQAYVQESLPLPIPAEALDNLEKLTEFLFANGFQKDFIRRFMDWRPFRSNPNRAHLAVADFLTCGAAHSSITANYDNLVEKRGWEICEEF
ncbi:MAG TPA: hypothetical protein VNW97_19455 [Candidatus Saccharimonadales bacterium]|jgi:NAD-dependent SIR2 family protein deacetylase|nr:hypothetical protein [Candidatus Saccharimonadales bacterium]